MQQYFVDIPLSEGETYIFTKEQAHHLRDVLRMDHETLRLVDPERAWFAECMNADGSFIARIMREDPRINEPSFDITLAMALIRKEKFELVLQKAAELGAAKIVPFESSRCIVRARSEKADKLRARYESILVSASEQCKRNKVPTITGVIGFEELTSAKSEINIAAYENADRKARRVSECVNGKSITAVIGPEGGFSEEEVQKLVSFGFEAVTLGPRILRAETAAVYALSVIAEEAF